MIGAIKTAGVLRLGVMGFAFLYAPRKAIELHRSRGESLLDLNKFNEAMPERTMTAAEILNGMAGKRPIKDEQANAVIAALLRGSSHARY
jgi:hypothetical protein